MEFWKLFTVALMPVLKVLLMTAVGTFLALDRFNILREKAAKKHLNTMVFFVFGPALVSTSLAKTMTFAGMIMLWFMPLNVLLAFIIGTALGWLVIKITRAPHHLHGLVLGSCAAGNIGILPLIIVPAVCKENSNLFGDVDVCYKKGLAYATLSMALGTIYIWSYAYNIVRVFSCKNSSINKVDDSTANTVPATETDPENQPKSVTSNGPLATDEDRSQTNHHLVQLEIISTMPDVEAKVPRKAKITEQLKILAGKINLKKLFAPPQIAAVVGIVIGVVPQFRKLLVGDEAPLHVVQDSTSMLGEAAIPTMTLLIGANLLKGLKGLRMQLPHVIGIIVVRYIALPAIGIGIFKAAIHFGLIHHDPLYHFVLLLQFAVPPATAISTITQLFGVGEGECSVIMLATYSCATVSLTLWCTFFVWLVL